LARNGPRCSNHALRRALLPHLGLAAISAKHAMGDAVSNLEEQIGAWRRAAGWEGEKAGGMHHHAAGGTADHGVVGSKGGRGDGECDSALPENIVGSGWRDGEEGGDKASSGNNSLPQRENATVQLPVSEMCERLDEVAGSNDAREPVGRSEGAAVSRNRPRFAPAR
jgi:hypothetical protein